MGKSIKKKLKEERRRNALRSAANRFLMADLADEREWSAYLFGKLGGWVKFADPGSEPLDEAKERRIWEEERRAVTPKS